MPLIPEWMTKRGQPIVPADVIVYREGDYAVAVDGKTKQVIAHNKDHAEVIQKAIQETPEGGLVFIAPGIYYVNEAIVIDKNINIYGAGGGWYSGSNPTGTLLVASKTIPVFYYNPDNHVYFGSIRRLEIYLTSGGAIGIYARQNVSDIIFEDLVIHGSGTGIFIRGDISKVWNVFINRCWIESLGKAIRIGSSTDTANNIEFIFISNCIFFATSPAIKIEHSDVKNVRIFGNRFSKDKTNGIEIVAGEYIDIYNNWILDEGTSHPGTYNGIVLSGTAKHIRIVENKIGNQDTNNMRYAISITDSVDDVLVKNNKLVGGVSIFNTSSGVILIHENNGYITERSGVAIFSGDGSTVDFLIGEHGLSPSIDDPSKAVVRCSPASPDAVTASPLVCYLSDEDGDGKYESIRVKFASAPPSGTNNVKVAWEAEYIG